MLSWRESSASIRACNAVCTLAVEAARERGDRRRRGHRKQRVVGSTARRVGHDQGRDRNSRNPLDRGVASTARPRSAATMHPLSRPSKAAGAIVFGKTNVPQWSGDFQTFNDDVRHDQQSVGSHAHSRRIVGRRCGSGRMRHVELRDRHRHRWIGARAVRVLRCVRPQAIVRRRTDARLPRRTKRRRDRERCQRLRTDRAAVPAISSCCSVCSQVRLRIVLWAGVSNCLGPTLPTCAHCEWRRGSTSPPSRWTRR